MGKNYIYAKNASHYITDHTIKRKNYYYYLLILNVKEKNILFIYFFDIFPVSEIYEFNVRRKLVHKRI
eukprot:gene6216-4474_t